MTHDLELYYSTADTMKAETTLKIHSKMSHTVLNTYPHKNLHQIQCMSIQDCLNEIDIGPCLTATSHTEQTKLNGE